MKANDLKDKLTNFVLGTHQYNFVLTEAPEVKDSELLQAMRWKMKDLIEYDIKDATIDCFPIHGQKERGRQPMAYVVTASTDVLKSYIDTLDECALRLSSIDIPAMSQRNIAQLLPEDEAGVALLVMNEKQGLLTLTRKGELYLARDLEVGYSHFSGDDKVNSDSSLQLEGMPAATQGALDQIVLEVQRSIDYYERYFAQPAVNSLVIAPMPVSVTGMIEYIAGQLGIQVRELDMNPLLGVETKMDRQTQSQCFPAIGAALRWPFAT